MSSKLLVYLALVFMLGLFTVKDRKIAFAGEFKFYSSIAVLVATILSYYVFTLNIPISHTSTISVVIFSISSYLHRIKLIKIAYAWFAVYMSADFLISALYEMHQTMLLYRISLASYYFYTLFLWYAACGLILLGLLKRYDSGTRDRVIELPTGCIPDNLLDRSEAVSYRVGTRTDRMG